MNKAISEIIDHGKHHATRQPLRIGIACSKSGFGGIQTCIIELIAGLNHIGITPDVLSNDTIDWIRHAEVLNFHHREVAGTSLLRLMRILVPKRVSLIRLVSSHWLPWPLKEYDFIYNFTLPLRMPDGVRNLTWFTGPELIDLPNPIDGKRERDRNINILRRNWLKIRKRVTGQACADPKAVYVTHSDWIADEFRRMTGRSISVIWPPVRSRIIRKDDHIHRNGFLYLSRIVSYKRPEVMLDIAAAFPGVRVTVAGASIGDESDYTNQLMLRAKDQGLNNICFVINPDEATVSELFATHKYFIFPAWHEHFGIATVEAIRAGLLPIVHDSGGQREIVPIEKLRFKAPNDLIDCCLWVQSINGEEYMSLSRKLMDHTLRGDTVTYQNMMLNYLTK